jgi:hypothetical protein
MEREAFSRLARETAFVFHAISGNVRRWTTSAHPDSCANSIEPEIRSDAGGSVVGLTRRLNVVLSWGCQRAHILLLYGTSALVSA